MRYISYSEFSCFYEYGKEEYFKRYILGIQEPPTEPLIFGSIVHSVLSDDNYKWEEEIKKLTKFPQETYVRIIKKISSSVPRFKEQEKSLFINLPEFDLYAGIDGVNPGETLAEYKTGKQFWTQEKADEHDQITHYILCWKLETGEHLPCRLISINSANGKHKEFYTYRTKEQLDEWMEKLINFKKELQEIQSESGKSWWESKCPSKSRIQL